jgi:putative heme-binding domain-containing protein
MRKFFFILLLAPFCLGAADPLTPERVDTLVAVFSRLEPAVVNGNDQLKVALKQLLDATVGEPRFVGLVKRFGVKGRVADLLAVVAKHPNDSAGVEAMGMVLNGAGQKAVVALLTGKDAQQAVAVAKALGNSNNQKVIPLLAPLVTRPNTHNNVRREAVKGLANFEAGAKQILALARAGKLPASTRFTASLALSTARWPAIQAEAAKVLPPLFGQNAKPLPSVFVLAKRKGNVANGAKVFSRETAQCARCHKVGDAGIEVGPALTEIGTKLPKEELYESILDPSAGISFGYEAWLVTLKDGNVAFGIIVSETPREISVMGLTGVVTKHAKTNVKSRAQQPISLMPPGLHLTMKESELVDLIEYLASLKKR